MRGVLAAILLCLTASASLAADPNETYRDASRSLGQMATLDGRVVRFEDVENTWTLPPALMPTSQPELKRLIRDRALNGLRDRAALALAPKLMPDCPIEATQADLDAFYPYWRKEIAQERARRAEMGLKDGDEAKLDEKFAQAGIKMAPQMPMAEMLKVDNHTPGAEAKARIVIRNWKLEHCIQARYGGDRFFAQVGRDGAWPAGPMVSLWSHGQGPAILTPAPGLEALTARGRFFQEAQTKGLLRFHRLEDAAYFFARYEGETYDRLKDDKTALAFLATPPWAVK